MRILVLVVNRMVWFVPTLLGLLAIVFFISHVIPADPAAFAAGENASAATIAEMRQRLGLDQPLHIQFLRYVQSIFTGDMGRSIYTGRPVSEDLLSRLPATLELTLVTVVVATLVGVPLGVVAALKRNSWIDHALRLVTIAGLAIASFWFAILLQLFFSMQLGITPLTGRVEGWGPEPITGFYVIDSLINWDMETLLDAFHHMVLPVATLALPAAATIVRFTRAGVLNALESSYVLYETAMGYPRWQIVWKYVLRNALIGTVTQIGLIFGILLAGAVVVEAVFDWPGLGLFAVNSILNSDYNAVMGFTLVAGTMFIVVNLVVDILQGLIDPRETR
ncbi:ABC transporter permease [Falsiroseomonas selenitidurans]|uniref:ABC transporter permease n=1 Tax=Falsiroseomonas selenitidurans TaxID=2716335 RepID=A0ABX1E290_9PROT|nr:ABC transporter permease [Falsiroseomonas selenitidurans]NKC31211.1 ABC transporter permease [Falsiroseomonas selenitidurans]